MKKVLVVTYYYPPCAVTASNRVRSWAASFHAQGIYPIFITRHWRADAAEFNYSDAAVLNPSSIEKTETYEVHKLPFHGNLRTKNFGRSGFKGLVRKIFTLVEFFLQGNFHQVLPYSNLFSYCNKYLLKNKVDAILVTVGPFPLLKLGYDLNRKFGLPWIADYRDLWTVNGLPNKTNSFWRKYLQKKHRSSEQKWLNSAKLFTTVSPHLKNVMQAEFGANGEVVYNGFFTKESASKRLVPSEPNIVNFTYNGTIYQSQDFFEFLAVLNDVARTVNNEKQVLLTLVGAGSEWEPKAIEALRSNNEFIKFDIKPRVSYQESLLYNQQADMLLMFSHRDLKGIVSSKIFDYLQAEKPVLLYKSDEDILDEIISKSNAGFIAKNDQDLKNILTEFIANKGTSKSFVMRQNKQYIGSFSREQQAIKMAEIIKRINE